MLVRLTHAAIAFATTVVVYQAYVLLAVPFIEPGAASVAAQQQAELEQLRSPRQALHKHRELLGAYFPVGHWTLAKPPKTFETSRLMMVLDDYQPRDDGQVRVNKCVLIFFPRPRIQGEPAPRDAVVLEAPHGAVLQMDEAGRPGLSGLGRIQWGKLIGDIVVRSDMNEPGPQDDLLITTRDLNMNEDMIRTDDKVEMQVGPHWGRGRVLEIRLVAVERARASADGPQIGGIDSLEILHDVRAQLTPAGSKLIPGPIPADQGGEVENPSQLAPPVKIASRGKFRFDFPNNMASFVDQVQVVQQFDNGQRDQLFCDELNLYLAAGRQTVEPAATEPTALSAVGSKPNDLARLRPGSIEAKAGDATPVILEAPTRKAMARCDRMRLELDARRVTFDGKDEVVLKYDGSEIHAPMVQYAAPPKGSTARVGRLLAAGNGWIRALTGDDKSQLFEARWTDSMRLERLANQPVLSLRGRPRIDMVGFGTLWANHLKVILRERKTDGSEAELLPSDVVPQRIVASGLVGIESPELSGKVNQLDVNVDYQPSDLQSGSPAGKNANGGGSLLAKRRSSEARAYHVVGDQLQVYLTVRGRRPEVSNIGVNGNVVFRETSAGGPQIEPLVVRAQTLNVKDADKPHAQIDLRGQPATITAAGMSMHAEKLRLNRGTSRAWIDSPGHMELPMDRNLQGQPLASPEPLSITWQNGMQLDEDRITFRGKVRALTADGVLNTERLVAVLSSPVRFDGAAQQEQSELQQIECSEGVHAQFQQRDQAGLISAQVMELESISVNQRTGKISGVGPGELESVHLTKGGSPASRFASGNRSAATGQRLGYLHVQFRRGVSGNLHERHVQVSGDTEAVYGPVDAWEQKLQMSLRGRPGPGTIWISSDQLGVAESPLSRRNPEGAMGAVELSARGNVTIEGPYQERGMFTARADRADYDQSKSMLVLEGNGTHFAEMHFQKYPGAVPSSSKYRKFTYFLDTEELRVDGFAGGEWNLIDLGSQPR